MREFFKNDKNRILNIKLKKFKNFKKNFNINRLHLNNFFSSPYKEITMLAERLVLLESLMGELFIIHKIKFYNNNKKHARLGILIFLKIVLFKKKIFECLSYFFILQLFFFFEYFIKSKNYSVEFSNYFTSKSILSKSFFSTKFSLFTCWLDLDNFFINSIFNSIDEVFEKENNVDLTELDSMDLNLFIFSKFNYSFNKLTNIIKTDFFKLCIIFFKRKFLLAMFSNIRKKKYKKILFKKYLFVKKIC